MYRLIKVQSLASMRNLKDNFNNSNYVCMYDFFCLVFEPLYVCRKQRKLVCNFKNICNSKFDKNNKLCT